MSHSSHSHGHAPQTTLSNVNAYRVAYIALGSWEGYASSSGSKPSTDHWRQRTAPTCIFDHQEKNEHHFTPGLCRCDTTEKFCISWNVEGVVIVSPTDPSMPHFYLYCTCEVHSRLEDSMCYRKSGPDSTDSSATVEQLLDTIKSIFIYKTFTHTVTCTG